MSSTRTYLSDITLPGEKANVMGKLNAFSSIGFMIAYTASGYVSMMENGYFKASLLTCSIYVGAFIFVWFAFDGKPSKSVISQSSFVSDNASCHGQKFTVIDKSIQVKESCSDHNEDITPKVTERHCGKKLIRKNSMMYIVK